MPGNIIPFRQTVKNPTLTAFGEALFGQLHPQFQGSFEYTVDNTDLNANIEVNGGTVTQADAMAVITSSATIASTALFESHQHAKYRSGLGGVIRFTSLFTPGVAATEQYCGIADENGSDVASGSVELTGGGGGSVDGITVDGVGIMSGAEAFDTDLTETARNVVNNINANTSAPNYSAESLGVLITITSDVRGTGPNTFAVVASTTTITTTDINLSGGTNGAAFKNGLMIGFDGTTFGFHRFQNNVKTTITLADWQDPLDGSGVSGDIIDATKLNVFYIQFQYLGAGSINIYRESKCGDVVLVNTVEYAGLNIVPSTYNPNYHYMMWVNNKATTDNLIIKSSSYAYFIEGKTSLIEIHQPENASGTKTLALSANVEGAIFTIRNKETYASKTNFIDVQLLSAGGSIEASSANNLGDIRIVKNAVLGGDPVYNDINTNNSVIEIDVAGTTVTGGTELESNPLAGKNDKFKTPVAVDRIILNPGESLTFAGVSVAGASIKAHCVWRELF